jgi:cytochrome P450
MQGGMSKPNFRETMTVEGKNAFIARLHEELPIYRDENGFWIASRFDDVREILLDHARFSSSAMGSRIGFPLLTDDPPRHSVLRGLLAKAFTPAAMETMRPVIDDLARGLVAKIPKGEEVDIVAKLTIPLPVAVIAGMLGVPSEHAADFKRWSDAIIGIQAEPFDPNRIKTLMELRDYFAGVAAARRAQPGDDLISALTRVSDTSETLNDDQVVAFSILLMVAGNETTTNLLGNLLDTLARMPEAWAALRADPNAIDGAIEESLRFDAPVQFVLRRTKETAEIGGVRIPAGEMVLVYLAGANRDPSRWNDPANFALNRIRERHVAFGHGVHTCIGAPLARIEAKAAMTALVERFERVVPGKRAAERMQAGILFGFHALPLVFG